jgi:Protein of unknown function (DUF2795)
VNSQRAAELQTVLEGIALPATRRQLIDYAAREDASFSSELERLPDREYSRIDEIAEELVAVQPARPIASPLPKPESGKPPGGADYLRPHPSDTGRVRHDAPRDNPPQKAIEQQTKTQKRQKAAQGS